MPNDSDWPNYTSYAVAWAEVLKKVFVYSYMENYLKLVKSA